MKRRDFVRFSASLAAAGVGARAAGAMPMTTLGKTGLRVSRFTLGGYHMAVRGEETAIRLIHRAMDLGVNLFDSAYLYHDGRSDEIYGKALGEGRRQKVFLMTKAQLYSRTEATRQLDEQLKRMKTDYLDLWQCHQVSEHKEVDQILGPSGALEAFVQARKQGKVRHIGFTGHRDPSVHLRLLESTSEWETIQMPINLIDPHYLSFIHQVLPVARKKGLGVLAMKSNAMGEIGKQKVAAIEDCLRFTWSQDIDTLVSGVETAEQLEQNVGILKSLTQLTGPEVTEMLERTKRGKTGQAVEKYKLPEKRGQVAHRDGESA